MHEQFSQLLKIKKCLGCAYMKIFWKISLSVLLLAVLTSSVVYADGIYTFIGKHPQFEQQSHATVFYIIKHNSLVDSRIIFLQSDDITIKVSTSNHIDLNIGDVIKGRFNKTGLQAFHNSRTHKYFDGEVLCKRIPVAALPPNNENNTYIKGENNTYEDNTVIKGENSVNSNNAYIAGSNNTITGNTHYQGSNNVYEDNVIIGSSDNTIKNTTTYGKSNRTINGQTVNKSNKNNSNPNKSSYSAKNEDSFLNSKPVKIAFSILMGIPLFILTILQISYLGGWLYSILVEFPFFSSLIIVVAGISFSTYYKLYLLILPIAIFALFCIKKYLQYKKEQEKARIEYERKQKEEAEKRRIEYERKKREALLAYEQKKQREREALLAYMQEQKRISNLPIHYVGNIETGKYHHRNCYHAKKLHESKKEYFETADNAEKHRYIPCAVCNPQYKKQKEGLSCEREKQSP